MTVGELLVVTVAVTAVVGEPVKSRVIGGKRLRSLAVVVGAVG